MAELLYELWNDPDFSSQEMSPVTEIGDKQRRVISPNAIRVHSFYASSYWDAYRKMYAWNGYGEWPPPPGEEDYFFTDEEAEEQRRYLEVRDLS